MIARLALTLLLARAPFQCASDPDPNRRLEDTPSEALWRLAERFEADGDPEAREVALREILERYPSSAEAERARRALGEEPSTSDTRSDDARSDDARSDDARSDDARSDDARSDDARSDDDANARP